MKQEERLTTYSDGIAIPNMENEASENVIFTKITVRLAEYEDTGLSPAEIEALKHRAEFAEKVKASVCENAYTVHYDKFSSDNGMTEDGFNELIDNLLKQYEV